MAEPDRDRCGISIVQHKVLTPNDFANLGDVERRLAFERRHDDAAKPLQWKIARSDLARPHAAVSRQGRPTAA
jgi:hypothetical protein